MRRARKNYYITNSQESESWKRKTVSEMSEHEPLTFLKAERGLRGRLGWRSCFIFVRKRGRLVRAALR